MCFAHTYVCVDIRWYLRVAGQGGQIGCTEVALHRNLGMNTIQAHRKKSFIFSQGAIQGVIFTRGYYLFLLYWNPLVQASIVLMVTIVSLRTTTSIVDDSVGGSVNRARFQYLRLKTGSGDFVIDGTVDASRRMRHYENGSERLTASVTANSLQTREGVRPIVFLCSY